MPTRSREDDLRLAPLAPAIAGLLLFLVGVAVTLFQFQDVVRSTDARKALRETLVHAVQVFSSLKDIETGERGFILTGDEAFLEPSDVAMHRLDSERALLRSGLLAAGMTEQIAALDVLVERRLGIATEQIAMRRALGAGPAIADVANGRGKQAMDELRKAFEAQERELRQRMATLDARVHRSQDRALVANAVLGVLGIGLLVAGYALLRREHASRLRAEQALGEVASANARLLRAELASVFEALPYLFFRLAPDGRVLECLGRLERMRFPDAVLAGRRMQDLLPADAVPRFDRALRQLAAGEDLGAVDVVLGDADGRRHFELALARLPGTDEAVAIAIEVTERVRGADALRALSSRLQHDVEDERRRLAREVHDRLGQVFTALKLELAMLGPRGLHGDAGRRSAFDALLDDGIRIARSIAADLRPPMLDDLGLGPALEHHARQFAAQAGFALDASVAPDPRIDGEQANQLFRIAQEALTNVARHAGARRVVVSGVADAAAYELCVEDDGVGLPAAVREGLGLLGMRERAAQIGASIELAPADAHGTRLVVHLPLGAAP